MKKDIVSALIFVLLFLVSCDKYNYHHDNSICEYKNYVTPEKIKFSLSDFNDSIHCPITKSNDVKYLNSYNFIKSKNGILFAISDSLYQELDKEYKRCIEEIYLNKQGSESLMQDFSKTTCFGEYYFCGTLNLHPSLLSLIFLRKGNKKVSFQFTGELLLYNIKDNAITSMVELSKYDDVLNEEDVSLKTYLIEKNLFLQTSLPFNEKENKCTWTLNKKNNSVYFDIKISHQKPIIDYALFRIDAQGYINFISNVVKVKNISTIDKEGDLPHSIIM